MPFISSSEAKYSYFMSGEATNEIYFFSLHEMNKWHILDKKFNFLSSLTVLSVTDFFCTI